MWPVVVTGAAGFLGRALVAALAAGEPGASASTGAASAGARRRHLVADRRPARPRRAASTRPCARPTPSSIWPAAPACGTRAPMSRRRRHRDNVPATAPCSPPCRRARPLVVASSSSVYGGAGRPAVRERRPAARRAAGTPAARRRVEALCARRAAAGGRVTVRRGRSPSPARASGRTWRCPLDRRGRAGRPLPVLGSPARTRDVTDVRDVAARAGRARRPAAPAGPVNIGTGRPRTAGRWSRRGRRRALGAPPRLRRRAGRRGRGGRHLGRHHAGCARSLGFVPRTDLRRVSPARSPPRAARALTRRAPSA